MSDAGTAAEQEEAAGASKDGAGTAAEQEEAAGASKDGAGTAAAQTAPGDATSGSSPATSVSPPNLAKGSSAWWWFVPVFIVAEFWLFGHRGEIHVCVGKTGVHDFSLVGEPRNDTNRWKFPRCEERLNIGLRSELEAQVADATQAACRGATTFHHRGEASACAEGTQGWEHSVTTSFVPPWDARYYERLLWFFYRDF